MYRNLEYFYRELGQCLLSAYIRIPTYVYYTLYMLQLQAFTFIDVFRLENIASPPSWKKFDCESYRIWSYCWAYVLHALPKSWNSYSLPLATIFALNMLCSCCAFIFYNGFPKRGEILYVSEFWATVYSFRAVNSYLPLPILTRTVHISTCSG